MRAGRQAPATAARSVLRRGCSASLTRVPPPSALRTPCVMDSARSGSRFQSDLDFCPDCGSILPLPGAQDTVTCVRCSFRVPVRGERPGGGAAGVLTPRAPEHSPRRGQCRCHDRASRPRRLRGEGREHLHRVQQTGDSRSRVGGRRTGVPGTRGELMTSRTGPLGRAVWRCGGGC